ncbi:MAG: serine/threonine protein kinase, partial [Myxococcales bacterium]|nr:serine/threonine protein kinase [Myxococcales bacterium]
MPHTTKVAARTEPKTELMASPRDTEAVGPDHDTPWRGDTAPPTAGDDATPALEAMLPHLTAAADRYAVGRELGRGGMGHVLEAQDVALDRPVALKLLNEPEDSSLCLRFVDEARVTGQLQHPGVPPVYDLGTLGDGRLFFAMKRIEGRTLREVIEDLREDGPEARNFGRVRLLTVFSQICRAIAYAHSRGVMHRDLKPDNIMLGAFGEVTVMDWGLAKPFDGPDRPAAVATRRGAEGRFATQAGEVTGTPHYMPPEQAAGRIDELGPHSDIYSLGAVLYELLTLEPPFDGPTARAIRDAVATQPVVPPSRRAPDRDIPHDAEQLCLECLSKEPAARPRSAAWVADQVDQILEGDRDRARKAEERDQQLTRGQRAADNYFERVEQHRLLHARTAKLRARIDPWADDETRRPLWQAEDAESAARLAAARSLSEALAAYHAALGVDGDHFPTRRALCALYYAAFEAAERDGDAVQMAHYENFVRAYDDDETYAERIKGDGALEVETSPKGLTGTLFTYAPVDRVLTPTSPRRLERLPAVVEPLAMGSYLLKLRGPG